MRGLVLEGGGAKGAYHAGALKALFERGYHFDGVAGTSIGAINGAMVAQGDFDKCYEIWESVTPSKVLDIDDEKVEKLVNNVYDKDTLLYFFRFLRKTISNRGLSMEKAQSFLGQYIDEQKLRNSPTDFCIVTVSITDDWLPMELFKEEIPEGKLYDYVIASAYFPAFKSSLIDGKKFMDGGIYDNLPINPLIRKGYNHIIAIRTKSNMPHQKVIDSSVLVEYIIPSEPLGNTLTFTNEKIRYNINLGYYDALRFMDKLVGKKFYIKPLCEGEFFNFMCSNFSLDFFKGLSSVLDVKGNKEELITKMSLALQSDDINSESEEIFISLLEKFGEKLKIEKFKIYSLSELVKAVAAAYKKIENEEEEKEIFSFSKGHEPKAEEKEIFKLIVNHNLIK